VIIEAAAAVLIAATPPTFCEVAKPIYIWASDMRFLMATTRGRKFIEQIQNHNDMIIKHCGELPRSLREE
jgi:hypothetical protein